MRGRVLGALTALATAAANVFRGSARQQAVQHQPPEPVPTAEATAAKSVYVPIRQQPVRRKRPPRVYVAGRYRDDGFDGVRLDRARAKRARKGERRLREAAGGGWC